MQHLTNADIWSSTNSIEAFLESSKVSHVESIRLKIMLEEILLSYQDYLGEDAPFSVKNKRMLRRAQIVVEVTGKPFK